MAKSVEAKDRRGNHFLKEKMAKSCEKMKR
jgi:hypothetical protein